MKILFVIFVIFGLFWASSCSTVVSCGVGTIAVPNGVDPDGSGFFVDQDGQNFIDRDGKQYKNVTCQTVLPLRLCGEFTIAAPQQPGDEINPDGGGFFVDQDGGGFFVDQDGFVPVTEVCVVAEPAP